MAGRVHTNCSMTCTVAIMAAQSTSMVQLTAEFPRIRAVFERLLELGPGYGYHPESSKSSDVVVRHNLEQAKVYFADLAFKVQSRSRYLGGFVGEDEDRDEWLDSKIVTWVNSIKQLSTVTGPYPRSAYAGMHKSVQAE
jgi:hypothetical protein